MNITYLNKERTTEIIWGKTPVIQSKALKEMNFIEHGFSTRLGGVSIGIYESMNLSYTRGDREESVLKNFRLMAEALHLDVENMVYAMQTHTVNILKAGKEHCGMGVIKERNFKDIDGLVTNEPGVCLVTSYADCVPLYFADPVKKCVGLSHSGWRGTAGKIAVHTVLAMQKEYGSDPKDITGFIGPSICEDCYEVSADVVEQFKEVYRKDELSCIIRANKNNKYQLNLQRANVYNMLQAGMKKENIHVTDLCTCCNPGLLYSHRSSKGERGGLCGFLQIKEALF